MLPKCRALRALHLVGFLPDATTSPVSLLTATTDGSSTTIPRPRTAMIVLADPMSIAIESETRLRSVLKRMNERVFRMNKGDGIKSKIGNDVLTAEMGRKFPRQRFPLFRPSLLWRPLPINLEKRYRLHAILDRDGRTRAQRTSRVAAALARRIAQQDLSRREWITGAPLYLPYHRSPCIPSDALIRCSRRGFAPY